MDLKIQRCQKPLIKGKTAFVQATKDSLAFTETEQDAGALLSNASFELNRLRKDLIKPGLATATHICASPLSEPVSACLGTIYTRL